MMIRFYGMALSLLTLSMLSSCTGGGGGGGGESNISPAAGTLSGVAAVGAPIVNGNISVSCSAGSALSPTTTSSTGAWQVTLSGQTLPCAVEVSGGTISGLPNTTPYHSIAVATGTVNVTPLTDLIVANLAGTATPTIWFAGLSTTPTSLAALTQAQVDAALVKLRSAMSGLTPLGSINPITVSFTPSSGNVSDDMLTALRTAMTNTGVTYESLLSNASLTAFAAPVTGFNTALAAAYAGTASGTAAGGTPSADSGPGISGVLPPSATPGTTVTIGGTNFAQGASNYQVSFNGTTVTPALRTLTQLAVIVPTGATTGSLTVTDLTTNQVYTVPGGFTVTGASEPSDPGQLAAVCPNTFTQTQLNQIVSGMTVSQVNSVFGCAGRSQGGNNWYMWYNDQSLVDWNMNFASVYFTDGVYVSGTDTKYIIGAVVP